MPVALYRTEDSIQYSFLFASQRDGPNIRDKSGRDNHSTVVDFLYQKPGLFGIFKPEANCAQKTAGTTIEEEISATNIRILLRFKLLCSIFAQFLILCFPPYLFMRFSLTQPLM